MLCTRVCFILTLFWALSSSAFTATTYYVDDTGSNGAAGDSDHPWLTLQHAADSISAGDTVIVRAGTYNAVVHLTTSGTQALPITFRGEPGAILDGTGLPNTLANRDLFYVEFADWVIIENFTFQNANRSGVRLSNAHHVTVRNCLCTDNGTWGIFTDFSDDTLLENNECRFSEDEHGIYISNSSDRAVLRGNHCHHNSGSGLQINADPAFLDPGDGISTDCLVENNICHDNGVTGGAAINLASVRTSVIRNNLVWGNRAGGIVGWGNGEGPEWGCTDNTFVHNTVWFRPGEGRWCISLKEGSVRNVIRNNILFGGARGAVEFDDSAFVGWAEDHNLLRRNGSSIIATNESDDSNYTLAQWQTLGMGTASVNVDPQFVNTGSADFHLQAASPARDVGLTIPGLLTDLTGAPRVQGIGPDLGAYEFTVSSAVVGWMMF